MELPNYFLADLPPEASLTPGMLAEACQTLKRNRETYLLGRSTDSLVRTLSDLGGNWLDPDYRFRKLALAGASHSGFPAATLARGLDSFFQQLTADNLHGLLLQDLGHSRRLDEPLAAKGERDSRRAALARGPELLVHIAAGNIPNPTLSSLVLGLLVRAAQFVKCASGGAFVPRLFAHSLYEADPKLAACLELGEWPGRRQDLADALLSEGDCVTATGSDETLESIRSRLRPQQRFLGYGHRVSFGYITRESQNASGSARLGQRAAVDVAAWNQLGCLSPHVFYLERGGRMLPEEFAERLGAELERLETTQPRGEVPDSVAAAIASRRSFYEVRAAYAAETRLWTSARSTAWTVIYEADPLFQTSCLHRFVYVKPVAEVGEALRAAETVRGRVSTVGLAATEERAPDLAGAFARWGATRICPLGQMQQPPLAWRHDGRPALGDLVTWTDWEEALD